MFNFLCENKDKLILNQEIDFLSKNYQLDPESESNPPNEVRNHHQNLNKENGDEEQSKDSKIYLSDLSDDDEEGVDEKEKEEKMKNLRREKEEMMNLQKKLHSRAM